MACVSREVAQACLQCPPCVTQPHQPCRYAASVHLALHMETILCFLSCTGGLQCANSPTRHVLRRSFTCRMRLSPDLTCAFGSKVQPFGAHRLSPSLNKSARTVQMWKWLATTLESTRYVQHVQTAFPMKGIEGATASPPTFPTSTLERL